MVELVKTEVEISVSSVGTVEFQIHTSSYPLKVCRLGIDGIPVYFEDRFLAPVIRAITNCSYVVEVVEMLSEDVDEELLRSINRVLNYVLNGD